jgi:hypothetical protein
MDNINHCIITNTVDDRSRELAGRSVDQDNPCVCKTEDLSPSSQEAATDLSEREKSGRMLIIDIAAAAAAVFVFLVVVVVVLVGVDGFSETDTIAALSKSCGVEGVTVWQAFGPRRKPQVTVAL